MHTIRKVVIRIFASINYSTHAKFSVDRLNQPPKVQKGKPVKAGTSARCMLMPLEAHAHF